MTLSYDPIEIDRTFANVRNPYLAYQGYQNPYAYASGYTGAASYMTPYMHYGSDRKFGFKPKFEHSSHGWEYSKKKSKKKTAALSALTLLAFLFFLNLLQTCLKDQLAAVNPTVMVLTAAASKSGDETILPNEQRSNEQRLPSPKSKFNITKTQEPHDDDNDDDDSFDSFEPATHKSIIKETNPSKHYHIRRRQRKQNGQKTSKHKSTTTISPKLMNYYNMKNDYY